MMSRSVLVVLLPLLTDSALATEDGECREIVATFSFMLDAQQSCDLKLREGTAELAHNSVTQLKGLDREVAVWHGSDVFRKAEASFATHETFCNFIKHDFVPMITMPQNDQ